MGKTSSRTNTRIARKSNKSKGTLGQATTVASCVKLDNTIKQFDVEFGVWKKFVVKNLKIGEIIDSQMRRLITTRERMLRIFEKWRDELDDAHKRLANLYTVRDAVFVEIRDVEDDYDPDEIADREEEIEDLNEEIEKIETQNTEVERDIRLINTLFKDVERSLRSYKTEHETINFRLCQKLAFIGRSRECAIAQRKSLVAMKKGQKMNIKGTRNITKN